VVWTLVVWVPRIRNIWSDDELSTRGQLGRTVLALSLIVPALIVAGVLWRRRGEKLLGTAKIIVIGFASWTVVVWLVRGGSILLADHDAAFKAVHTVLAVVSIGLSALAVRSVTALPVGRATAVSR
jgi:hypothetical protein